MDVKVIKLQSISYMVIVLGFFVIITSNFVHIHMSYAELNPIEFSNLMEKGKSFYDFRNFTEAATYFERALAIDPTDIDAMSMMGFSLGDLNKPALVIEYYDKVLTLDPENTIKFLKDSAESDLVDHNKNMKSFDLALSLNPKDKEMLCCLIQFSFYSLTLLVKDDC